MPLALQGMWIEFVFTTAASTLISHPILFMCDVKTQQIKLFILIYVIISTFSFFLVVVKCDWTNFHRKIPTPRRPCLISVWTPIPSGPMLLFLLVFALCFQSFQTFASQEKRCREASVNVAARVRIIMLKYEASHLNVKCSGEGGEGAKLRTCSASPGGEVQSGRE